MKNLNLLFVLFFFTACYSTIPSLEDRKNNALFLIKNKNFYEREIQTSNFSLFSFQNSASNCKNKDLKVYIEGDGLSWITKYEISKDPTPINSIALKLMNQDDSTCKVYLARPCQFINSSNCNKKYWTSHRFSIEVIQSFTESLDYLKKKYSNKSFTLIGYSGGGAIATLLTSKRKDINMIITVAGNLDIKKWTDLHNISKLQGSLNPSDYSKDLQNIEQYHLIGSEDKIIPKEVFFSYFSKFDKKDKIHYDFFDASHNCCWEKLYKDFLKEVK